MANYLAMNRDELTAEKAALEAKVQRIFRPRGLKLNMARGKPGPHQMDLAMDLLKMNDYTTELARMPATMASWKACRRPACCLRMSLA